MDLVSDTLCQVIDAAELCSNVHSSEEWRDAAREVVGALSELIARLNVNRDLFRQLVRISRGAAAASGDEEVARMCASMQEEFERDGMHLEGADRDKLVQLNGACHQAAYSFVRGANAALSTFTVTPASALKSLPQQYLALLPPQPRAITRDGPITLSTHPTLIHGILTLVPSSAVRKAAYTASMSARCGNVPALAALVRARQALAREAGCESYAHYITRHRMAGTPQVGARGVGGAWVCV